MSAVTTERAHARTTAGRLRLALLITAFILGVEAVGGVFAQSLALLADAGHMLTDVFALGLAWFAAEQALRPPSARRTYGYHRTGILVALLNAVLLVAVALLVAFEAYRRLTSPQPPVNGALMLGVAALGLAANVVMAWWLAQGELRNLNVRSALLHVIGDAGAAAGVLVAGAIIAATAIYQLDPIASLVVAVLICFGAWRIIRQALDILMEGAPHGLDTAELLAAIRALPGVKDVHDLHVWSISSEIVALSCHLVLEDQLASQLAGRVGEVKQLLQQRFAINHSTIEVECEGCGDAAFCVMVSPEVAPVQQRNAR